MSVEVKESKLKAELKGFHKKTIDAFEKEELEIHYEVRMQKAMINLYIQVSLTL